MNHTANINLPFLFHDQFSKEWTLNKALTIIDAFIVGVAASKTNQIPPSKEDLSSIISVMYIVPKDAKGDWSWPDGTDYIVIYIQGEWIWIKPKKFMSLWIEDKNIKVIYNGAVWTEVDELGKSKSGFLSLFE